MAITAPRDVPCKIVKLHNDGTRTNVNLHPMDIVLTLGLVEQLNETLDPQVHDFIYQGLIL